MRRSIPVLYYHRVGSPDGIHLSIPAADFARQMQYLADKNINIISASQLFSWLQGNLKVRLPAVCITFDDGFLDNYRYAHPVLQKYGGKAALFMATSLVRPANTAAAEKLLPFNESHTMARRGDLSQFLSAAELQEMADSGVWEIYSHTHSHSQAFTDNEITGSYPDTDNHWGILSAYSLGLEKGKWPVFRRNAALLQPAMKIDGVDTDDSGCVRNVKLLPETNDEFAARVKSDLTTSRMIIGGMFPRQPALVCWPWGKADALLESRAADCGYVGAFRTDSGANYPGMNLMQIKRFPVKKKDLLRFAAGIWLRSFRFTADIYAFFRNG
jgi:hypothetical protein